MNFFYAEGGALVCDEPIKGVTWDVWTTSAYPDECRSWYGGHRYFVGESMNKEAAKRIRRQLECLSGD